VGDDPGHDWMTSPSRFHWNTAALGALGTEIVPVQV